MSERGVGPRHQCTVETAVGEEGRISKAPQRLALFAAAIALGLTTSILAYGSGRGLDLTDEIFYLVWARNPDAYALTYQPFGYVLHPLYVAVGGNLQHYRLAGFAIAAAAGAFLGCSLPLARTNRPIFALYGAQAALTIFFPWIITPSYNSAANVAALLMIAGLLNLLKGGPQSSFVGTLAAAGGLAIAAFSKPPLFAIAVSGIAAAAVLVRRRRMALIASLALGGLFMTVFVRAADLLPLVQRIIGTQHVLSLPNTASQLPLKVARDWLAVPLPLMLAVLLAGVVFLLPRATWAKWLAYAAIGLSFFYIGSIIPDAIDGSIPDFLGLSIWSVALAYAALVHHEGQWISSSLALLFTAPTAVALGTFNNQWFQLNFSMAFAFLALFALASIDRVKWRGGTALMLSLAASTAVMLLAAWAPYSLPAPILEQQAPVEPPLARGTILVDEETAAFVRSARGLARGALLVDLSGTGPGVGSVLGARVPVLPWLNPATPSWPDVVWSHLSVRERQAAWFVVPVWPLFTHSGPAKWLAMHKGQYCSISLPEIPFWGEERVLRLLRPCPKRETANT